MTMRTAPILSGNTQMHTTPDTVSSCIRTNLRFIPDEKKAWPAWVKKSLQPRGVSTVLSVVRFIELGLIHQDILLGFRPQQYFISGSSKFIETMYGVSEADVTARWLI